MYKFEIKKEYQEHTGKWKGIIEVVENNEGLPLNILMDKFGDCRREFEVFDIFSSNVDNKLDSILTAAKKYIELLRNNKIQFSKSGNTKHIVQF